MANGLPINLPWQNITDSELLLVKTNIAGYFLMVFGCFTLCEYSGNITSGSERCIYC